MLEEVGLPYDVHPIHIGEGDQFKPEFLKISPNNKIPAIVDRDNGYAMFESGAILIYLADKAGKLLPPQDDYLKRMDVVQWLMFQMGGVGPFSVRPTISTGSPRRKFRTPSSATSPRPSGCTG